MAEEIYKVMLASDKDIIDNTGFIPEAPADKNCVFIHSCDKDQIENIKQKFFKGKDTMVLKLNPEGIRSQSFKIVYESNTPGGTKYWHLYRPYHDKLLSAKCSILEYLA